MVIIGPWIKQFQQGWFKLQNSQWHANMDHRYLVCNCLKYTKTVSNSNNQPPAGAYTYIYVTTNKNEVSQIFFDGFSLSLHQTLSVITK